MLCASVALVLAALVPSTASAAAGWSAKCTAVFDGDTIVVTHAGTEVVVRLFAIDCPEKGQPFHADATKRTRQLLLGKQCTLYPRARDNYGRTVAWVFLGKACANAALVQEGWAWWYAEQAPRETRLGRLQHQACRQHRGLWAKGVPVPPWDYRARQATARPPTRPAADTVYITRTGKCFHRKTCKSVRNSRIPLRRSDALRRGYRPCLICKP